MKPQQRGWCVSLTDFLKFVVIVILVSLLLLHHLPTYVQCLFVLQHLLSLLFVLPAQPQLLPPSLQNVLLNLFT